MKHGVAMAFLSCMATVASGARSAGARAAARGPAAAHLDTRAGRVEPARDAAAPREAAVLPLALARTSPSSLAGPLPTIEHKKLPGQGYAVGSPLYRKQEVRKPEIPNQAQAQAARAGEGPGDVAARGAPAATLWACWEQHPLAIALSNGVYAVLVLSAGYLYRESLKRKEPEPFDGDGGLSPAGALDLARCAGDPVLCLVSLLCPGVRWAATVSGRQARLLDFWAALALALCLSLLSLGFWLAPSVVALWGSPPGFATVLIAALALGVVQSLGAWASLLLALALFSLIGPLAFACAGVMLGVGVAVGVVYRQRMRRLLGHSPAKRRTLNLDVLAWCCCLSCVLSQEASEADSAIPEAEPEKPSSSSSLETSFSR